MGTSLKSFKTNRLELCSRAMFEIFLFFLLFYVDGPMTLDIEGLLG